MQFKRYIILLIGLIEVGLIYGQGGTWTWVKGSNQTNQPSVFGTMGVPDVNNTPQGFYEANNWIDQQGNFWIFGGCDSNFDVTSDLWKYNPTTNIWTWMGGPGGLEDLSGQFGTQGVPSPGNWPGARGWGSISWTDNNGNLWLWGGDGFDAFGDYSTLNDLWKYNIASNEWTWMSGSEVAGQPDVYGTYQQFGLGTSPGGRQENSSSWIDEAGNFWLFGGMNDSSSYPITDCAYNDLWEYNINNGLWAWMKGPQGTGNPGNYGTLGVESPTNLPPPRGTYTRWKDASGAFYIWGGIADFAPGDDYSDVWKFNVATLNWTWVGGDSTLDSTGDYGFKCVDNGRTGPMARGENRTAQVLGCSNAFLTFGGFHWVPDRANPYVLNDLWLFNTLSHEWRWISGTNNYDDPGNYGTQGVASPNNVPPGRYGVCMWTDNQGNLWLFTGQNDVGNGQLFNDMWKFVPDEACLGVSLNGGIAYQLSPGNLCLGDTAYLSVDSSVVGVQINPTANVTTIDEHHYILYPTASGSYVITGNSLCKNNDSATFSINVNPPGHFTYSLSDSLICAGASITLNVAGALNVQLSPSGAFTWQNSSQALISPTSSTSYTLVAEVACTGNDTSLFTIAVDSPSVNISATPLCVGDSANVCATAGFLRYSWNSGNTSACFYATQVNTYQVTVTDQHACTAQSEPFTLNSQAPGQFNYSLSASSICAGNPAVLTFSGDLQVQFSPASSVTLQDATHALLEPDTNTVYTVVAILACAANDTVVLPIQVVSAPVVNITADTTVICPLDSVLLCVSQNFSNYNWSTGSSASCIYAHLAGTYSVTAGDQINCRGVSAPLTITYVSSSPFVYQLSDTAICYGNTSLLSYSGSDQVRVFPVSAVITQDANHSILHPDSTTVFTIIATNSCTGNDTSTFTLPVSHPVVSVVTDTNVICADDSVQICASAGFASYAWNNGANTSCIYTNQSGNYYVSATDANNCVALSNHVTIKVNPVPDISISISRDTFTVYGDTVLQWYLNDVPIAGATGQFYVASQPGSYSVKVLGNDGCTSVSNVFYYTTDIGGVEPDEVDIYPNPLSTGTWHLQVSMGFIGQTMEIYDDNGRIVYTAEIHSLHTEISPGFASGVYFLRINSSNNMIVKKIVKM